MKIIYAALELAVPFLIGALVGMLFNFAQGSAWGTPAMATGMGVGGIVLTIVSIFYSIAK